MKNLLTDCSVKTTYSFKIGQCNFWEEYNANGFIRIFCDGEPKTIEYIAKNKVEKAKSRLEANLKSMNVEFRKSEIFNY